MNKTVVSEAKQRANLLTRIGVAEDAHAVVFEDSSTGVAAGQAAGCYTFGCTRCAIGQDLSGADELIDTFVGLRL